MDINGDDVFENVIKDMELAYCLLTWELEYKVDNDDETEVRVVENAKRAVQRAAKAVDCMATSRLKRAQELGWKESRDIIDGTLNIFKVGYDEHNGQ